MKTNNFSETQPQSAKTLEYAAVNQSDINFVPSPDEVARRAYFSYENEGSKPGRDVQHWLAAEAEIINERNRTRVHGYHNAN